LTPAERIALLRRAARVCYQRAQVLSLESELARSDLRYVLRNVACSLSEDAERLEGLARHAEDELAARSREAVSA
jgi:hypothetical protein